MSRFAPCALVILALSYTAQGSWAYDYQDDFSTNKAMTDSYDHSVFWPETAIPPAEPYLFYTSVSQPAGRLAFAKYPDTGGMMAYFASLAYCFPLGGSGPALIMGTMEFDVYEYATEAYMAFSTSPDGTTWTLPTPVDVGHQSLPLGSSQGTAYIRLDGHGMSIDNLHVTLVPEPASLALLALGGLAVIARRR